MFRNSLIVLAFLVFIPNFLKAQQEEMLIEPMIPGSQCRFAFENPKGSVNITGYDGTVVLVKGRQRDSYTGSTGNQGSLKLLQSYQFNLSAEVRENEILLKCETFNRTVDFDIMIPRNFSLNVSSADNGQITILRLDGEIEARNTNGNIDARNVSGPVVLSTVFGEARVAFSKINPGKPSMITSYDGNVEVTLPGDSNIDVSVKTAKGKILTDLDLKTQVRGTSITENGKTRIYKQDESLKARLNKGGTEIILSSYYGDITIKSN